MVKIAHAGVKPSMDFDDCPITVPQRVSVDGLLLRERRYANDLLVGLS